MNSTLPPLRVCAWCEKEHGPVAAAPGQTKTHGICRRHTLKMLREAGVPDAEIHSSMSRQVNWCPDLSDVLAAA